MSYLILFVILGVIFFIIAPKENQKDINQSKINEAKFIVSLVAKVVKSDGIVSKDEAILVGEILDGLVKAKGLLPNQREELKNHFNIQKNSQRSAFSLAFEYKNTFDLNLNYRIDIVYFLLNIAFIDGDLSSFEKQVIIEICDGFDLNDILKNDIFSKFEKNFKNLNTHFQLDPYEVLGVSKDMSFGEIKKKYRELVRKYHPDILIGNGASEDIVSEATKKLKDINVAYEMIEKEKNLNA
ncbi:DnaJ domain-containing protein [Campylobacter sp. FMV-PI01]|uniref:DnaJ domain-containing protein n=1 Tax=Campylobacter portucalensis TaxID=2608384 RepID=A0A6L5WHK8_9BACT|nr:DnaJ domain-containing protein [Campylobacter portucalensis]MSN96534.1 DnaJ domain-containing protein [Campylobacter portucalensis]